MKKILYLALFVFGSCSNDKIEITKTEYQQLKNLEPKPMYPKPFELFTNGLDYGKTGIVLGSDGHDYLVINYANSSENVEHYIECAKCKKQNDSLYNLILYKLNNLNR